IQRAQINLWQWRWPVLRPALFGINSTSGCMIPVSLLNVTQWLLNTIQYQPAEGSNGECSAVPTHHHIHVWGIMGSVQGVPQTVIQAVEIRVNPCLNPELMQNFPVSSSVTFTDNPLITQPPRSRFSINFTEFDCDRNDVCWPELAFPLTRYYTGEGLGFLCLLIE
uniref:Tectonic family member 2 n=1 Tax=Sinocyclocheilus rhinocerous TaxID=307959 RepID=A0A673FPM2_9TELE